MKATTLYSPDSESILFLQLLVEEINVIIIWKFFLSEKLRKYNNNFIWFFAFKYLKNHFKIILIFCKAEFLFQYSNMSFNFWHWHISSTNSFISGSRARWQRVCHQPRNIRHSIHSNWWWWVSAHRKTVDWYDSQRGERECKQTLDEIHCSWYHNLTSLRSELAACIFVMQSNLHQHSR